MAHKWARWLHSAYRLGVPTASQRGADSEVAHKWATWLHNPCRLRGPHRFRAGGHNHGNKIFGRPKEGGIAKYPMLSRGSPKRWGRHGPRFAGAKGPLGAVIKGGPQQNKKKSRPLRTAIILDLGGALLRVHCALLLDPPKSP